MSYVRRIIREQVKERMGKKLCHIYPKIKNKEKSEQYFKIVKDAKYVCKKCGRAANDDRYLCRSVKL